RLGGRVETSADSFTAAIANERRASTFAPTAADDHEAAARMKALLEMSEGFTAEEKDAASIVVAVENFAAGSDNMAVHRKLYAAEQLLKNELAPDEAMKLTSEA